MFTSIAYGLPLAVDVSGGSTSYSRFGIPISTYQTMN
jgi:hypothetical protein